MREESSSQRGVREESCGSPGFFCRGHVGCNAVEQKAGDRGFPFTQTIVPGREHCRSNGSSRWPSGAHRSVADADPEPEEIT